MYRALCELVAAARAAGASDVHLVHGLPPKLRVDGALASLAGAGPLDDEALEGYATAVAGDAYEALGGCGELDLAFTAAGTRVRANVFRQKGHTSLALRLLSDSVPPLSSLGLPKAALGFPSLRRGIVLVTGETGSGKSTTLAAVVDAVNESRADHIITLEDPIEYLHEPKRCVVNQREIGVDSASYADALRAVLREDPDVILIGEMRDYETIQVALTAAETGHLVLATLHTNSAAESVDRMVDVFPAGLQRQARLQLSTTLQAVLSQQLLPRAGGGRVLAVELMVVTPAIRNLIREAKTPQIANALATSAAAGSVTMDNSIVALARTGAVSRETAVAHARDQEYVARALGVTPARPGGSRATGYLR